MTKEQKELLMKDLCVRFPYEVKVEETKFSDYTGEKLTPKIRTLDYLVLGSVGAIVKGYSKNIIKPYLFPLSSMTKKQRDEFYNMIRPVIIEGFEEDETLDYDRDNENRPITQKLIAPDVAELDWLNAHHFDYRGLIEQDLAIDATGLNIYKEKKNKQSKNNLCRDAR